MIIVDTSGVLAAIDPRQAQHAGAARTLLQPQRRILSPFVLAELDYLVGTNSGPSEVLKLLGDVARGAYELRPFSGRDIEAAIAIIERYAALNLSLADASVMVLAARYACLDILTLDRRHFRAVAGLGESLFACFLTTLS
jgi:predicted nucleic acid-binding protein